MDKIIIHCGHKHFNTTIIRIILLWCSNITVWRLQLLLSLLEHTRYIMLQSYYYTSVGYVSKGIKYDLLRICNHSGLDSYNGSVDA